MDKVCIDGLGRTKDDVINESIQDLFAAKDFEDVIIKADHVSYNTSYSPLFLKYRLPGQPRQFGECYEAEGSSKRGWLSNKFLAIQIRSLNAGQPFTLH